MNKLALLFILILLSGLLIATPVDHDTSQGIANAWLSRMQSSATLSGGTRSILQDGITLAHVWQLSPTGYIVVASDDRLLPVPAYSFSADFGAEEGNILADLLACDLASRLEQYALLDVGQKQEIASIWHALQSGSPRDPFQQWPPVGYSPSGGWLKTEWTQDAPYNNFCPMDPVTNQRSIAGCPAVAMAQILNFHQTVNGTTFTDADDYYHNYAGRAYYIDNDAVARDFPDFPTLNQYLSDFVGHYSYSQDQTNQDKAALVFACGVAATQVYTSSGSGTFAVSQAYEAFQKFGFDTAMLITQSSPDLYTHMAQNIMNALPVHLAVVTPAWDAGHNVVVDGYNTDGYFHINFGWGGTYSGWYLIPDQIPYNLTVLEGAVLDIIPRDYLFVMPDSVLFNDPATAFDPVQIEAINTSSEPLTILDYTILPTNSHADPDFMFTLNGYFTPYILQPGQSLILSLQFDVPVEQPRELYQYSLRIIHANGYVDIPLVVDSAICGSANPASPPVLMDLSAAPNPFRSGTSLSFSVKESTRISVDVFNLRGQKVRHIADDSFSPGNHALLWDGLDKHGQQLPSGIYFIKAGNGSSERMIKVLKIN